MFLVVCGFNSCKEPSANKKAISNYEQITVAIRACQESRLQFQNKFAAALESYLQNDSTQINYFQLREDLQKAKRDNEHWQHMAAGADEVDVELPYRQATVAMFSAFDDAYNNCFPEIINLMYRGDVNREQVKYKTFSCHEALKNKSAEVVRLAKMVVDKYDVNRH